MREILFRGKVSNIGPFSVSTSDEWAYGGYVKDTINTYIYSTLHNPQMVNVDPETVGQFTGLTDKNNKRIFEGDICDVAGERCVITYQKATSFADFGNYRPYLNDCAMENFEIIGNIHDNPELLKNKEEKANA